ncbi:MAG: cytochrome P450 [Solirubrobacteraceae bacterium]
MGRSIAELPGPRGLPLLGNALQLPTAKFHAVAEGWCERYGPICRFDVGRRRIIALADADAINTVLRDRPDGYRRWREIETVTRELAGTLGVFHVEGADWRHQRRLAVTALNSNHLQRYFDVVRTCTERLRLRLARAAADGGPVDIGRDLTAYTVDVTSTLAFGHDLNTIEQGEGELQEHIQRVFDVTGRRLTIPVPYWRYFKLPYDRAADRSMAAIHDAITTFITQARTRITERPQLRQEPENFLESMIAAQEQDNTFTDAEIVGNVFTLLLAGEDTTAHTMAWTLWYLSQQRDIQARWTDEADHALGDERSPSMYDTIGELRYGEAVLREAMRLKPVAPVLFLETLTDTLLADTHLPAGTRLLLLTRQAGLRATGRAREFDPSRWLGKQAPDQKTFLPFGAGPRFCPGRNLAFLESKAALAMIARNFHIELDQSEGPVTETFQFTMAPNALRIRLTDRAADPQPAATAAAAAG